MYGTAIEMLLRLATDGSQGRMEKVVGRLRGEMKGIRESVDLVLAKPCGESCGGEGALLMSYSPDDRNWWHELRRGLARSGYGRKVISGNMDLIQGYVKELDERGAFQCGRTHSRSLGNGGFEDPLELEVTINRGYGNDLILEAPIPRHAVSVQVRRIGYLEEQLLRAPDLWIETMEEDDDTDSSDSRSSTPTLLTQSTIPPRGFSKSLLPRSAATTPYLSQTPRNFVPRLQATRVERHGKNNKKSRKHREQHSENHGSHHKSHPVSISKSSTSSSSKSSSTSKFTRSFWGFMQRPKERAR